jgi:hypothetical protein
MNMVIEEIHLPLRIYTEPLMTGDEFFRVRALNDTVSIEREPDGGILVKILAGSNES